jgi:hypothetical protein
VSTSRSTARSNGAPRRPRYQIGDWAIAACRQCSVVSTPTTASNGREGALSGVRNRYENHGVAGPVDRVRAVVDRKPSRRFCEQCSSSGSRIDGCFEAQ